MSTDRSTPSASAEKGPAPASTIATVALITPLEHVGREDIATVGGKGAHLGEMLHAGLPVPTGSVLTIDAYRRFYEHGELGTDVVARLAAVAIDDPDSLQNAARSLRDPVLGAEIPVDLRAAILEAYHGLSHDHDESDVLVAVRSSAAAEDTAQFSFAGTFESFLNVHG